MPADTTKQPEFDPDSQVPNVAYLLLKYRVSGELTMVVDGLPKSHKVGNWYIYYIAIRISYL